VSVPCGRSHNPPHRSQYFSSIRISWTSIPPADFMIASLLLRNMKMKQHKKSPGTDVSAQGSFLLR
jgi:hypothetical protein